MTKPKLRIVRYDPHDYSLAGVLTREHARHLDDPKDISATFSLYFQWPGHRRAIAKFFGNDSWSPCEISFDEDEREASELIVTLAADCKNPLARKSGKLVVRFEIFRACYEFETSMLGEIAADDQGAGIVVSPPDSVIVFKHRRAPRYPLSDAISDEIRCGVWRSEGDSIERKVTLAEMSVFSVSGVISESALEGRGELTLAGKVFQGDLLLREGNRVVVVLRFETGPEAGQYFDIYRKVAFPQLAWRYELPEEGTVDLYDAYLAQHIPENRRLEFKEQLSETWTQLKGGTHEGTADYAVLDSKSDVVGASSLALAFKRGSREIWAFHQLCTLKNPDNLSLTEILYTWRCDYLLERPEDLEVAFWYVSKSRWLERIYTKFKTMTETPCELQAVAVSEIELGKRSCLGESSVEFSNQSIGAAERLYAQSAVACAAIGPRRLNIMGILDHVVPHSVENATAQELLPIVDNLSSVATTVHVTLPVGESCELLGKEIWRSPGDRFARFSKKSLLDFRASVEHSLAVTYRKLHT